MRGRIRTALFTILVLSPCASLAQTAALPPVVPPNESWFDHPEILCSALQHLGFPGGRWRALDPRSPVYQCEFPPLSREDSARRPVSTTATNPTTTPPVSVFFQVSGGYPNQADRIAVSITINTPIAKPEAKRQMLVCIRALYRAIGQNVPRALPAYIDQDKHYLAHQPYGIVSFFFESRHDRRPEQLLWFRLGKNP